MGSSEVLKYPYCGNRIESKEFLSEKICRFTIRIRKKIIKKAKSFIIYGDLILRLTSIPGGIVPSRAIGISMLPNHPPILTSMPSTSSFQKERVIAMIMEHTPDTIVFTETQINKLYEIALKLKCPENRISREELIAELRGGDIKDYVTAIGVIMAIIGILFNISDAEAFQIPPGPGAIPPPHLSWLYGNSKDQHPFGFEKKSNPRSQIITDATRNAGSEKNQPFNGSLNYQEIMDQLGCQSHHKKPKKIEIAILDETYILKSILGDTADDLSNKLAPQIYESIRKSDTDISDIARNLGFKPQNIKKIKDHVFFNQHYLDRYPEETEYKRFDPNLRQALAWKRLEVGSHTKDDITWLKHECVEQFMESLYDSGYSEAHQIAQKHFNGDPWETNY